MNVNTTILLWLFQSLQGVTPWEILAAYWMFLVERIEHDQQVHDAENVIRWRNLLARLPEVPL